MEFNKHEVLEGEHAFLSPSVYHWVNYTKERLIDRYASYKASIRGTEMHAFAENAIKQGIKLSNHKKALNKFVNDSIDYGMKPETVLYYSDNCFGTADAISFNDGKLFIFDLKTGIVKASFTQLDVYAALFCLEYGYSPNEIQIEERIYQGKGFTTNIPTPETIESIMETIIHHDQIIEKLKKRTG